MKEFKKPDVTAPRFRPAVYNVLNKEFFKKFKQRYPKYKNLIDSDIRNIIKKFNTLVYQNVIEKRDGIQLPNQVGWLFIGSCQESKKRNINFAKSLKYGVTVTNNNFDTDGKLAKIFFTNFAPKHKMKNREFWSFVACREFKRNVAKNYCDNWNMYMAIDSTKKLNTAYNKEYFKDKIKKETEKALINYNEFDI
jgi:hypothetical protein